MIAAVQARVSINIYPIFEHARERAQYVCIHTHAVI